MPSPNRCLKSAPIEEEAIRKFDNGMDEVSCHNIARLEWARLKVKS